MILVTGGTGLVGSHLLYELTQTHHRVRAIYRTEKKLEAVKNVFSFFTDNVDEYFQKIEWVKGDITDVPKLDEVFVGITHVYHAAALVSFDPKDYVRMRQVNIEGTANMVNLSIAYGIKKFCFVSSIAAVGEAINVGVITEENEWNDTTENHGYSITKYGAEMEVWRGSQEGLDVVIVNPGVILGGGFWNEGSGKLFTQVYNGFKFYTEGVTGFVGVEDVVKAMIELMNSSIKNERFILVSENKSFKEVLFAIADAFDKKRPSIKIGKLITELFWRLDWIQTKLTGKIPLLTKNSAKSSHTISTYSSKKIEESLQFNFRKIGSLVNNLCEKFTTN
ncbi:NAD-dependent epimerase [Tenacibaculum holothuriorum]|uniref:NAD-dependent epimerase n=1 Tax=Tenacibaculum holothuriorum TaxID=1635173 RepID=A0A1Y2PAX7_9FLAO|nr:NAD-dependent epimerase/dehydratase family protein [Tenacibaculum holothuriorum]OSY87171.1 NAD-dependent epimerase [Tenacibaculum holothuriorum]